MFRIKPLLIVLLTALALYSCSKKIHPTETTEKTVETDSITVLVKKEPVKVRTRTAIPKVIIVNDNAAHKSVDGRYYYDLQGHRYWRNNKDGKYYLFNKSMFTDDAFKKIN